MYQEFMILSLETDLIEKKFIVTTNNLIDPNTIDEINVDVYERETRSPMDFTLSINGEKLEVTLKDWPIPNTSYVFYLKTLKNILGQELTNGIKRRVEFSSCITKMARVDSPSMHQVIDELLIKTSKYETVSNEVDVSTINETVHIQVSTDNMFYNMAKETTTQADEILLTYLEPGQYYIRSRVEDIVDNEFQYGKWSETVTFVLGSKPECDKEVDEDEPPYVPDYDDMLPIIEDDIELVFTLMNKLNQTPQFALLKADKDIDEERFDPSRISITSDDGNEMFEVVINRREIMLTITDGFQDNKVYAITLHDVLATDGTRSNQTFKLITKIKPLYNTLFAVKTLIGDYKISDEVILFNIRESSRYADYVTSNCAYPFRIEENNVPFIVEQFVKYHAAHECLLRFIVELSSSTGISGTIGNVNFSEKETVKDITALLKHFCQEVEKWKESLKGYELEGRAFVRSGVRGLYASPETTPLALNQRPSYGRGDVYGGTYRGGN